jgi:hypothetical protein
MLADQLDYVIGVDPHRDSHAIGVVEVRTGGVRMSGSPWNFDGGPRVDGQTVTSSAAS